MVNNDYDAQFEAAGQHYDVDPQLLKTVFHVESAGNPKAPRGAAGEIGSFQLMPQTAQMLHVQDPTDMNQAIPAAAQYLRQGLDANNGDAVSAVRYYNGGPNGVNNPATMSYAQKAANLYPKMALQKPNTTKSQAVDPDIALGESVVSGKAQPQSTSDTTDPDIALGEQVAKQSTATATRPMEQPAATETSDNKNQPTTGENILAGAVHGVTSVGHTIGTGLNKIASYVDEKVPALGRLDQYYGIDPKANLAASNEIEQAYNKRYGDSTAASLANFGGQIVGTLPFTAGIGTIGGMAAKGVANSISNPLLSASMHGIGDIATGAAQGGVAAGLTGGDPVTGAITGGGIGAVGIGAGGLANALSSSNPRVISAISDQVVKLLSKGVGAHFGGFPGYLMGEAAGPIVTEIARKYGSGMAMRAAQALNSTGASTAAGIVGGKVNELERQ